MTNPVSSVQTDSVAVRLLAPNRGCAGFEEPDCIATPGNDQIEDALDQLLTRLLKERERERQKRIASGRPPSFRAISAEELAAMPIKSDQEVWREILIERPITGSLEYAIRELGEVLFQRGGTDLMRDVLERVASRHPKSYGHRATICDHQWDGIGGKWFC